jgi:hypothetical protein
MGSSSSVETFVAHADQQGSATPLAPFRRFAVCVDGSAMSEAVVHTKDGQRDSECGGDRRRVKCAVAARGHRRTIPSTVSGNAATRKRRIVLVPSADSTCRAASAPSSERSTQMRVTA